MATLEEKVINAVCRNKDMHILVSEKPELFGAFEDVFDYVKDYYMKHKSVPAIEVIQDKFSSIDSVDVNAPTAYYLDELRNQYVTNRAFSIMEKASAAFDAGGAAGANLEKMLTSLSRLGQFTSSVRDLDLTDYESAANHMESIRKIAAENGGTPGISTGFKAIDASYPTGLSGGHSIVLLGYTGRAKSMWSALLAKKAHDQGKKIMVISLEMNPEEYRERVYALMGEGAFRISDLSRGDVSTDDLNEFGRRKLSDKPGFIVVSNESAGDVTPNTIQAKIDTHKPDLVILDYLQLMKDNALTQQMTPRMMNLSREIKMLAVRNNVPIVSITAVTDEENDKRDGPPVLSQVSWSSSIEYDANLAIAVHRHDETNMVEIVCRKNRHGDLFGFFLEVDFDRGIWQEKYDY